LLPTGGELGTQSPRLAFRARQAEIDIVVQGRARPCTAALRDVGVVLKIIRRLQRSGIRPRAPDRWGLPLSPWSVGDGDPGVSVT
jgi:hypothetical protein